MKPEPVTSRKIVQMHVSKFGIRHADNASLQRADQRRAEPDLLNGADLITESAEVTDPDRVRGVQRHCAKHIFQRLLGSQRDGHAADAQAGQQCCDFVPEIFEPEENRCDQDHELHQSRDRPQQRVRASQPGNLEPRHNPLSEKIQNAQDHPGQGHHEQRTSPTHCFKDNRCMDAPA